MAHEKHGKKYRLNPVRRKTRIGFATLTRELPFAEEVQASLEQAAANAGLEWKVLKESAPAVGLAFTPYEARTLQDLDNALAAIARSGRRDGPRNSGERTREPADYL